VGMGEGVRTRSHRCLTRSVEASTHQNRGM
jgi:hypothetical protein